MKLFLLRHADADPEAVSDAERPLSDKGRKQSAKVGAFCRKQELTMGVILHSPLLRAQQTAEAFAEAAGIPRTLPADFLSPGMTPSSALAELKSYAEFENVLIVGHQPDFGRLAAALLGVADHETLHVRKASLALIDLPELAEGRGTLEFLIPSKLM